MFSWEIEDKSNLKFCYLYYQKVTGKLKTQHQNIRQPLLPSGPKKIEQKFTYNSGCLAVIIRLLFNALNAL